MKQFFCLSLLLLCPLFGRERFELERKDGSKLIAYFDPPQENWTSLTLLIPGSQKESALSFHETIKKDLLPLGYSVLTVEKRGVSPEEIDEGEFIRFLSIDERVADHHLVLNHLKSLPYWKGKLAILGQGDGGRVGASLASKIEGLEALILIGSGGGWSPLEERLYSFRSEMANGGYSPQYIHGFLVQAKREFAQALETPKVEQKAFGYTYKYWASLLKTNLLNDLLLLNCPIYSINGVEDDRVPIMSVDAMAKRLENRLVLIRKEKAGHEIIQDLDIYKEAISWLHSRLCTIL